MNTSLTIGYLEAFDQVNIIQYTLLDISPVPYTIIICHSHVSSFILPSACAIYSWPILKKNGFKMQLHKFRKSPPLQKMAFIWLKAKNWTKKLLYNLLIRLKACICRINSYEILLTACFWRFMNLLEVFIEILSLK